MTGIAVTPFMSTVFRGTKSLFPDRKNKANVYLEEKKSLQKKDTAMQHKATHFPYSEQISTK